MSGYQNGSESEGLGFNLCVAPSRVVVSLISKDRGRIGDRRLEVGDDFVIMTRVGQGRQGKFSKSRRAGRGLKRIMLREDYVEDKSIFELKKHTGVCTTYIARGLYEKRTKDYQNPEGIVNV